MPLTNVGCGQAGGLQDGRATSMTWWNWLRTSPLPAIPFGQRTMVPLRVPPQWLATCLVHW